MAKLGPRLSRRPYFLGLPFGLALRNAKTGAFGRVCGADLGCAGRRAHRDLSRACPLGLGDPDFEDAVLVVRGDLVRVYGIGQHEGALERAVAPLVAVDPLGSLLCLLLLFSAN